MIEQFTGNNSMMKSFNSFSSIYSEMVDNLDMVKESYDLLKGKWPEKYNELMIVLSDSSSISDLLVYSLGLRDTTESATMINKIMSGETVNINNSPLVLTYDDLLNLDLRLIMPTDFYKYNAKYDIYEDMSEDESFMKNLYNNAERLKIVGIVSAKEGTTTMALSPGVNYRSDLTKYIINYANNKDIVKKQLHNKDIDVISGKKFEELPSDGDFTL